MFLESLIITKGSEVIREIIFKKGLNLIVDHSANSDDNTGNNIGKTTVLKLVDFCFGAKAKTIWEDPEDKKAEYTEVKDFLINNEVLITLFLKANLDDVDSAALVLERNFISRGQRSIRRINGEDVLAKNYEEDLKNQLFPEHISSKPSIRQIISHNIRYKDLSLVNTLKTLDGYTSNDVYETLYLFLLGCDYSNGDAKNEIIEKIKQEDRFKKRLEGNNSRTEYETALDLVDKDILKLDKLKKSLNINENFEKDLEDLNHLRYLINKQSSRVNNLKLRKQLIDESISELDNSRSDIDNEQLKLIYEQANSLIGKLHHTFEELTRYHNDMVGEKKSFIAKELPKIDKSLSENMEELGTLLRGEKELSEKISKSDSFGDLEKIIIQLNEKYRVKGEYENKIEQLKDVEAILSDLNQSLKEIEKEQFSDTFEANVKNKLSEFNSYFSDVSETLYNEKYALTYKIEKNSKGQSIYIFKALNSNMSSGKKQGEIACFDIAYIQYADGADIPCLHFLMNDKKELMYDKQLVAISDLVKTNNVQFVASILKDKLPPELNDEEYFILKLSENDKLFKI